MNILFLSTMLFEELVVHRIYNDLFLKFQAEGHHLYIVSPVEHQMDYLPVELEEHITLIPIKSQETSSMNFLESSLSTFTLDRIYLKAIKQHFTNIRIDLVMYNETSVFCINVINYIKERDKAKTYLLLKEIFSQHIVDAGYLSKIDPRYLLYRQKEKKLLLNSDFIGCLSPANISHVISRYANISQDKFEILPNSIKPKGTMISLEEKNKLRQKYNLPLDKVIITYVGNINKAKGVDTLMNIIRANESNKETYILIIGTGNDLVRLEEFFNKEKAHNAQLISTMSYAQYERLLYACDVGMIAIDTNSRNPIIPTSLLLYMQASLPIIAAVNENSDINNILTRAQSGFTCLSDDIPRLNKLIGLMQIKEYREQLGRNGRHYLETHYTPANSYEIIMSHFQPNLVH